MALDSDDIDRVRELIEADRARHDAVLEPRFQEIQHDVRQVRNGLGGILQVIQEDIKGPLDSLVADQIFIRNTRKVATVCASSAVAILAAIWGAWPHVEAWLKNIK